MHRDIIISRLCGHFNISFLNFIGRKAHIHDGGRKKINTSIHIRLYQLVHLIKSYMIDVSSFQTKIQNKPLSLRSTDWKAFCSNNKTFDLVRVVTPGIAKRNKNWTFWGSPFSITIWMVYVIVRWREQGPSTRKLYFGNIILSTRGVYCRPNFFLASRKNISCTPCTPKISLLNAINHIRLNSKSYPSKFKAP